MYYMYIKSDSKLFSKYFDNVLVPSKMNSFGSIKARPSKLLMKDNGWQQARGAKKNVG